MTAIAAVGPTTARRRESPRHILAVFRLLFVNKTQMLYMPLGILFAIFLLNLSIWWVIIAADSHNRGTVHLGYTGAVAYIYVYSLIVAVQVLLRTFPFSLGFGVTRRDFYLGAALAFVALSLLFAVVLTIMSSIEIATHGWGVGGRMFAPVYFTNHFWLVRLVMYFVVFLFCLFVGAAIATLYVRWRALGISVFFVAFAVLLVAAIAEVTLNHQWSVVGNWFSSTGTFGLVLWTLVPTAIAAGGGYLVLRRATPKA